MVTPNNPTPQSGTHPSQAGQQPQPAQQSQQPQQPQQPQNLPMIDGVNWGKLALAIQKAGPLAQDVVALVLEFVDALTAQEGVHAAGPAKLAHPRVASSCDDLVNSLTESLAKAVQIRAACR
jgi:hypothetical protein